MTPERLAEIEAHLAQGHHLKRDECRELMAEVRRLQAQRDEWCRQCHLASEAQADGLQREAALRAEVERLQALIHGGGTPRGPELDAETRQRAETFSQLTVPAAADGPGIDPDLHLCTGCSECRPYGDST